MFTTLLYKLKAQTKLFGVLQMSGLLDELGKIAGAVVAEQGVDKLDPDAGFLEKAAGAFAGFEAAKVAEQKLENHSEQSDTDQVQDDQS